MDIEFLTMATWLILSVVVCVVNLFIYPDDAGSIIVKFIIAIVIGLFCTYVLIPPLTRIMDAAIPPKPAINDQNIISEDNTTQEVKIPEGYKFIGWLDEQKTSYIIEDAEGTQTVIILEQ